MVSDESKRNILTALDDCDDCGLDDSKFETKIHSDLNDPKASKLSLGAGSRCPRCGGTLVGLGVWSAACGVCAPSRFRACEPAWQVRVCVNAHAFLESLVKLNDLQT